VTRQLCNIKKNMRPIDSGFFLVCECFGQWYVTVNMIYFQCCPSSWIFFKHVVSETESVSIIRYKGCPLTGSLKWHDLRILAHMNGNLYISLWKQIQYLKCCVWKSSKMLVSVQNESHVYKFFPISFNIFSVIRKSGCKV